MTSARRLCCCSMCPWREGACGHQLYRPLSFCFRMHLSQQHIPANAQGKVRVQQSTKASPFQTRFCWSFWRPALRMQTAGGMAGCLMASHTRLSRHELLTRIHHSPFVHAVHAAVQPMKSALLTSAIDAPRRSRTVTTRPAAERRRRLRWSRSARPPTRCCSWRPRRSAAGARLPPHRP